MTEQEIARDDWRRLFDEYSRQHQGWLTTVSTLRTAQWLLGETGLHIATNLRFRGISVEAGARAPELVVLLANGGHIEHRIARPARLYIQVADEGSDHGLRIDSGGGETTLLWFRADARPDELNGVAHAELER